MKATLQTRLAYVITGDPQVDAISKAGLQGLTLFLAQRTALEPGEPIGVDPSRDELAFFPIIYWPVLPNATKPSPDTLARMDSYMKSGGTILFDTRDAIEAVPGSSSSTPAMVALRTILSSLDIPEIEPVPRDHVLTKTFFLLRDFPGRYADGQLWVEALPEGSEDEPGRPVRAGDGVSSIMITSNDMAGAWAMRPDGQPMLPLVPGDPRQRAKENRAAQIERLAVPINVVARIQRREVDRLRPVGSGERVHGDQTLRRSVEAGRIIGGGAAGEIDRHRSCGRGRRAESAEAVEDTGRRHGLCRCRPLRRAGLRCDRRTGEADDALEHVDECTGDRQI
jgi:hypothetical protein